MRIWRGIEDLGHITKPIHLAIGVFDGVHLGHQAVLNSARSAALNSGFTSVILSFEPHPMSIVAPVRAPRLLTSATHKLAILRELDFDHAIIQTFDREFSLLSGQEFVDRLLASAPRLAGIHVGDGWRFGHKGEGTVDLLRRMGQAQGFQVSATPPVLASNETVSSTLIRAAVADGDFARAEHLLGRPFSVLGPVSHGQQLGQKIGFPTANLLLPDQQWPPMGVYAVEVRIDKQRRKGIANLGVRPTVTTVSEPRLEVHIFDFSENLYEQNLEVTFLRFLRAERKFPHLDALKEQISHDIEAARA